MDAEIEKLAAVLCKMEVEEWDHPDSAEEIFRSMRPSTKRSYYCKAIFADTYVKWGEEAAVRAWREYLKKNEDIEDTRPEGLR